MQFQEQVVLQGSEKTQRNTYAIVGNRVEGQAEVSVVLKADNPQSWIKGVGLVKEFAHHYGLCITDENPHAHIINIVGSIRQLEDAFGVHLNQYVTKHNERTVIYRGRSGGIYIPKDLEPYVLAVMGLDTQPIAKSHAKVRPLTSDIRPQLAIDVAKKYNFPTNRTGKNTVVGLIELGGGYNKADLTAYCQRTGTKVPKVTSYSIQGAYNNYGAGPEDGEVELDIQVVAAVSPDAEIKVFFAPNTDQGFLSAIVAAMQKCHIISISWGGAECNWTEQAKAAFNQTFDRARHLGVTILVASGDNGSTDGEGDGTQHVDFPASSPYVIACGGTRLTDLSSETVWNDGTNGGATGGGVSNTFALPSYQHLIASHGTFRHVPDVAGNADPETGYVVIIDGEEQAIGGTSAVAPLYAGLLALIAEGCRKPFGFINVILYNNHPNLFNDITVGNNGAFSATKGYDCCTGLGSLNGKELQKLLEQVFN